MTVDENIKSNSAIRSKGKSSFGVYNIIAIILLIAGYMFLVFSQASSTINPNFKGIISQLQLLISIVLILKLEKPGKITAFVLNIITLQSVSVGHFVKRAPGALTGVIVAIVSIFIIALIAYLFKEKNLQYNQLAEQKKTTDTLYNELKKSESMLHTLNADLVKSNEELNQNRKKLHQLAYYDVLTGLPNRAMIMETIEKRIAQCHKGQMEGFSIVFLDLDDFKRINDTLGHQEGDEYLRIIGSRLSTVTHENDVCGRLSGDEFCIISLKHDDLQVLADYCERFREVVSRKAVLDGNIVSSGASIGVARYPLDGNTVRELLTSADNSMYAAKRAGKNSVNLPAY